MDFLTRNPDHRPKPGHTWSAQKSRPLRLPLMLAAVVLAAVLLAAALTLGVAAPASAAAGWTVTKITNNSVADEWPAIDSTDTYVVWQEKPTGEDYEICLWRTDGGLTYCLTANATDDTSPRIYGDWVVWQSRDTEGDWEIYLRRISTGFTKRLTDDTFDDTQAQIHGNLVVWASEDSSSGSYGIRMYNIATDSVTILTTAVGPLIHPQTDGTWVVWQAQRALDPEGDWEIEYWDGATPHRLTENAYDDYWPEISNHQIVWTGEDSGDAEIFHYAGGTTTKLTNNTRDDAEPFIDAMMTGTTVGWRYYDGSDWEVRLATKASGVTSWTYTDVTNNSVNDYPTDVEGPGGIVWYGGSGSSTFDIYGRFVSGAVNLSESPCDHRYPRIGQTAVVWQGRDGDGDWELYIATPSSETPGEDPEVEILSPVDGAVLTGSTAEISGTATDDTGVASVEVRIDSGGWQAATIDSGAGTASATWHCDWSLPMEDNDADHTISARVTDVSDDTGTSTDDPVVRVDRKGPAISGFTIDSGAAETDSTTVTLTYVVTDGSPPMQMRFSNDGTSWSTWETYAATRSWTLSSGAGTKTVWCSFKDAVGNASGEGLVSDTILLTGTAPPTPGDFTDVPPSYPYHDAIYGMRDAEITDGYQVGDTWEFRPGNTVFRAQFAKMICGVMGLSVAEDDWPDPLVPFTDLGSDILPAEDVVNSLYPHEYVAIAYLNQITKGQTATTFAPYVGIKRAQVVTMIVRAVQNLSPGTLMSPPSGYAGSLGIFDPEHGPNMRIAEYNGMLTGLVGFGPAWSPWEAASRGETAQMLWNLMNLLD